MKQGTLEKIQNLAVSLQLVTVEDMRKHSLPQLVTMIANKLNELMNEVHRFETDVIEMVETQNEHIQYLLGEGLHLEVATVFEGWLEDGTFDTLINQTALKQVNDRIDETNAQLSIVNSNHLSLSVKDFGAVGDGMTDDTLAFQNAIDTAIELSKTLFIPTGVYNVGNLINTKINTVLDDKSLVIRGEGIQTIINLKDENSKVVFRGLLRMSVYDLTIQNEFGSALQLGDDDSYVNRSNFINVKLKGSPRALVLKRCFDIGFINCRIGSYNDYVSTNKVNAVIDFEGTANDFINQIAFIRCHIEDTMNNGVQVYSHNYMSHNITFEACHFETRNRSSRAFSIRLGRYWGFNNCAFISNDYNGGVGDGATNDEHDRVPNILEDSTAITLNACSWDRYAPYTQIIKAVGDVSNVTFNGCCIAPLVNPLSLETILDLNELSSNMYLSWRVEIGNLNSNVPLIYKPITQSAIDGRNGRFIEEVKTYNEELTLLSQYLPNSFTESSYDENSYFTGQNRYGVNIGNVFASNIKRRALQNTEVVFNNVQEKYRRGLYLIYRNVNFSEFNGNFILFFSTGDSLILISQSGNWELHNSEPGNKVRTSIYLKDGKICLYNVSSEADYILTHLC